MGPAAHLCAAGSRVREPESDAAVVDGGQQEFKQPLGGCGNLVERGTCSRSRSHAHDMGVVVSRRHGAAKCGRLSAPLSHDLGLEAGAPRHEHQRVRSNRRRRTDDRHLPPYGGFLHLSCRGRYLSCRHPDQLGVAGARRHGLGRRRPRPAVSFLDGGVRSDPRVPSDISVRRRVLREDAAPYRWSGDRAFARGPHRISWKRSTACDRFARLVRRRSCGRTMQRRCAHIRACYFSSRYSRTGFVSSLESWRWPSESSFSRRGAPVRSRWRRA